MIRKMDILARPVGSADAIGKGLRLTYDELDRGELLTDYPRKKSMVHSRT